MQNVIQHIVKYEQTRDLECDDGGRSAAREKGEREEMKDENTWQ